MLSDPGSKSGSREMITPATEEHPKCAVTDGDLVAFICVSVCLAAGKRTRAFNQFSRPLLQIFYTTRLLFAAKTDAGFNSSL